MGQASGFQHRGNWPYEGKTGVKQWLIDGRVKILHKVSDPEEVRKNVKLKNGNITYQEAVNIVRKYWDVKAIELSGKLIRDPRCSPDKRWYLLLLGSPDKKTSSIQDSIIIEDH